MFPDTGPHRLPNARSAGGERPRGDAIAQAPGVASRNCGVHVIGGDDDGFFGKKIRSAAGAPSSLMVPKPPSTPDFPVACPDCTARAASASYNFNAPVASSTPWPTALGGVQVSVTDAKGATRLAPIYFVSPAQLSFLIPAPAYYLRIAASGRRTERLLCDAATPIDSGVSAAPGDQINLSPLPLRIGLDQKQVVIRQGDQLSNLTTVPFRLAP